MKTKTKESPVYVIEARINEYTVRRRIRVPAHVNLVREAAAAERFLSRVGVHAETKVTAG